MEGVGWGKVHYEGVGWGGVCHGGGACHGGVGWVIYRGGVGCVMKKWGGVVMQGWGGVCHVGVGWGVS